MRRTRGWRAALWRLRLARLRLLTPRSGRGFTKYLMDSTISPDGATRAGSASGQPPRPAKPPRLLMLIRHGQTTYNVEHRLPGQLPGVLLTDEGRRQAHQAAVALSALPLSAVVASPLERAKETAEIIARGWALPVRTDPRLMDTDVGPWAGQKIDELEKADPRWKAYVQQPSEPPDGIEGFPAVQRRTVAAVEDVLRDDALGNYVAVVVHADVVKLILAHYTATPADCARFTSIANASITALLFTGDPAPHVLAVNWTAQPGWLVPFARPQDTAAEQTPGGASEEVQPADSVTPAPSEAR